MDTQGFRLKQLLKIKGISNKEFAEKIGVHRNYVSILINNSNEINNKMLYSIANVIPEANLDWIKTGEGEPLNTNNIAEEASSKYTVSPSGPILTKHNTVLLTKVNKLITKLEAIENPDIHDLTTLKEAIDLKNKIQTDLELLK